LNTKSIQIKNMKRSREFSLECLNKKSILIVLSKLIKNSIA